MIWYMSREEVPDVEDIRPEVLRYLVEKAEAAAGRLRMLERYYLGRHPAAGGRGADDVRVCVNYARYVVDSVLGYYLGEPVKYDSNAADPQGRPIDLLPLLRCYDHADAGGLDLELGRSMGIYGEALELCYASGEKLPRPRSAPINPMNGILVCDDTVEHNKLFAILWERRESVSGERFYSATVYTDRTQREYRSSDLKTAVFHPYGDVNEHFFGEVPVIAYRNGSHGQGDFEQIISLMDAYNGLLSSRLTDKKKFVDALLVFFGMSLREGDENRLAQEKFIDGAPLDARVEYIQKTFDEAAVQVLSDTLVREMHKQTFTIDMSDEHFAGNSSGQALKLKLMTMNLLVRGKMRRMEEGLRERLRLYNHYLTLMGAMEALDVGDVDVVFTLSMPLDEEAIVERVVKLRGLVDEQTLLSQLWFIRDPAEAARNIMTERKEDENHGKEGEEGEKAQV